MLVTGVQSAHSAYTLVQLQEIERMILSKDCGGLWDYLIENPVLTEGDDPLALELRNFILGIEGGLIECLAISPGVFSPSRRADNSGAY